MPLGATYVTTALNAFVKKQPADVRCLARRHRMARMERSMKLPPSSVLASEPKALMTGSVVLVDGGS